MDNLDRISDKGTSKSGTSKHNTPNKRWKVEYDNFLVPLLVEKATKGHKCDKSFKRVAFSYVALTINVRFSTTRSLLLRMWKTTIEH